MNAFRTCATIGRSPVVAAAVSFFFIICFILFNGFIIARGVRMIPFSTLCLILLDSFVMAGEMYHISPDLSSAYTCSNAQYLSLG